MNLQITIDWKFVLAAAAFVFVLKMDSDAAERVASRLIDAGQEIGSTEIDQV